jgi:parallel beta-helix repeat protein
VPGSIDGIVVSGNRTNLWIGNGTLRGWGLDCIDGTSAQSSVFADLKIIGSSDVGLRSGTAARVIRCTAIGNSQEGILTFAYNNISQCVSGNNGASGIATDNNCQITDCQAQFNNSAGISTGSGCSISHCTAANNNDGILAGAGNLISACATLANLNSGVTLSSNSVATTCAASGNAFSGITIQGVNSTVKACVVSSNAASGIVLYGKYSTVEGCTASGNLYAGVNIIADGCLLLNNTCDSNGSVFTGNAGIAGFGVSGSQIEANHFSNNSHVGLYLDAACTHNIVARNVAVTNTVQTTSYNVSAANNDVGPMGRAATATSPWANLQY